MTDRGWRLEFEPTFARLSVLVADAAAFEEVYRAFLQDPRCTREIGSLWDLTSVKLTTFDSGLLRDFGAAMGRVPTEMGVDRRGARSAMLVNPGADFGIARMVESRAREFLGVDIQVYTEPEAATDWAGGSGGSD